MALLIPVGFAAFAVHLTNAASSHVCEITGGVDVSFFDPPDSTTADAVLGAFGPFASSLDSNCVFTGATLSVGQDGGDPVTIDSTAAAIAGTAGMSSLPANCAALVKKTTATGGRKGRGRWFIPWCCPEGNVDEAGSMDTSLRNDLQNDMDDVLDAFTANNVPLVLLHTDTPGAPAPSPVTALSVSKLIATQRRRLGR